MTDAAEGIVMQAMHQHMALCRRWAEQKIAPSSEEMLRLWTMQQQAGKLASEAVEMLFRSSGSTAARSGSRMLRYFGDV
jgi:3-hydroxy-9,10-secoandrosta-1,3,5(10)-triene-9,17-dione monooxygenase